MDARIVPVIRGLCIALLGAGIAVWMGTPLPWLLGPLFLTAATRVAGMPTRCPAPFNKFGRWVIGLSLGLYFSAEVMQSLAQHWGLILAGILYAQGLAVIGCWFYHRVGGLDVGTAWFSSAIGTASEIVNMAHRHGTRADHVATVHSVRVLLVVVVLVLVAEVVPAVAHLVMILQKRPKRSTKKSCNRSWKCKAIKSN